MADTHFANAHGLHHAEHYTTAYDISLMTLEALRYDTFRRIVATKQYRNPATNLSPERRFYNTNALLSNWKYIGYTYASAIGVKTGSTPEAGQCLVSAAVENGRTLLAVVLGAENVLNADGTVSRQAFSESKRLLQWGFQNFSRKLVIDSTTPLTEVEVKLSKEASYVVVHPDGKLEATLPNDLSPDQFERKITLFAESIDAPVEKGQVLGTVTLTHDGREYGTLNLVAANSVSRSQLLYNIARVKAFFAQLWVRLVILAGFLLLLVFAVRRFVLGGRRRQRRNRYSGYTGSGYAAEPAAESKRAQGCRKKPVLLSAASLVSCFSARPYYNVSGWLV
jgi:D-alanyl-D-alanine carboxypeptidase (penicillin-binding protein 5/6)